jgi:hypothetical protein
VTARQLHALLLYHLRTVKRLGAPFLHPWPFSMAQTVKVDVEGGVLQKIGGFGTYQKFLCLVVVGTISGICALSFATQLFSLVSPDHWCWNAYAAALEEQLPLSSEDTKKFSIPVVQTGQFKATMFSRYKRFLH